MGDCRVVDPLEVTPGYERTLIDRSNVDVGHGPAVTLAAGTLAVYRPGVFRPDRFRAGAPVTVAGREGFATTLPREVIMGGPDLESRKNPTKHTVDLSALAWQYADGAWATAEPDHLGDKTMPIRISVAPVETEGPYPHPVTGLSFHWAEKD